MLSDGIMHDGRLLVLNTFTTDVRQAHPHMHEEVEKYKDLILFILWNVLIMWSY